MAIVDDLVVALVPIGIVQIGVLIYFAGAVRRTLEDHDEQIRVERKAREKQTEDCAKCNRVVAVLANKEGIAL